MEELVKKMKKMTTAQLLVKQSKVKGEELEAVEKVLELRGQIVRENVEISEPEILTPSEELNAEIISEKQDLSSTDKLLSKEHSEFKIGDKISFVSAKNSKKAPGQNLIGIIKKLKFDEASSKTWAIINVENLGNFLKKSECLKLTSQN